MRLWLAAAALACAPALAAAQQQVNAICSTDQAWCELAAKNYQAETGVKVLQVRKAKGEALAQIRAEASNPKTDLWWGGTGDPFLQAAELGLLDAYRPAYLADLVQLMGEDAAFAYLRKLHRNVTQYTRSGTAQAKSVAQGEVGIGVSFIFGFESERQHGFSMVQSAAPCEGTSYEIGGIALVKGARNREAARRNYDWLMSPSGQSLGAKAASLQFPANKTFKVDSSVPTLDSVRLIKHDFEKSAAPPSASA